MADDVAKFAGKCVAAAAALRKANRLAVGRAALVYKESVLAEAASDTGGDLRLSHWGWKVSGGYRGVKLGAGYDVKGYEHAVAKLAARPQGPWKVLEYGAAPHEIGPRRRRKAKRIRLADGNIRTGTFRHPGTRGKRTWSKGITRSTSTAIRTYKRTQQAELAKAFGARIG